MERWKLAAFAAMLLLVLVIAADIALIARYSMLPRPTASAPAQTFSASARIDPSTKTVPPADSIPATVPVIDTSKFPPPPSANGATKEHWEGYYYYSLDPFEQAVANGVQRSRFWFDVRRTADGVFQAASNETSGLGDARIEGQLDRALGHMRFTKTYTNGTPWQYEGDWSAAQQRIVGTYGGGSGAFVLYPRRLRQEEIARYEAPAPQFIQELEPPGGPAPQTAPKNDIF